MGYYGKEFDTADLFHIQRDIVDKKLIRKKRGLVANLRLKRNLAIVLTFKFDVNEAQRFALVPARKQTSSFARSLKFYICRETKNIIIINVIKETTFSCLYLRALPPRFSHPFYLKFISSRVLLCLFDANYANLRICY